MFTFFPTSYDEEILYSVIARYHYYSGNVDLKDTLGEVTGTTTVIPTVALPGRLEHFCSQFDNQIPKYSSEYFIKKHTLFPFYAPFLPDERRIYIEGQMKHGDSMGIYAEIGIVAGSICRKYGLYYCPKCVIGDIEKLGEAYFRRIHQLQGVFVCPEHSCLLKQYPVTFRNQSRIAYTRLEYDKVDLSLNYEDSHELGKRLIEIAKSAQYLLENDLDQYNQLKVWEKYRNLLEVRGFITCNGTIKQRELQTEFKNYFSDACLNKLESNIDSEIESNWLKMLTRKPKRVIHPIRNLLFIIFLCGGAEGFFNEKLKNNMPFGEPPWPCLNPIEDHYKDFVIQDCIVSSDSKTKQPVGTFKCSSCGFTYSRRGPDEKFEDRFKVGRIKSFGSVWENKLKELTISKRYSIRELGRLMRCDPKTIVRYAGILGVSGNLNVTVSIDKKVTRQDTDIEIDYRQRYSNDIIQLLQQYPHITRKQLRERLKKQYAWFYRNDRKWLDENLPPEIQRKDRNQNKNSKVDWSQRDSEIVKEIENVYRELKTSEKLVRITKSLIGKRIGKVALLDRHIDRLPTTKVFLDKLTKGIGKKV